MNNTLFKKPVVKKILLTIGITLLSFVLLNVTFIFDFFVQSLIRRIVAYKQAFPSGHIIFLFIILFISWKIMTSKLNKFIKAVFLTVPLAVVYTTIGLMSYPDTLFSIIFCGLISVGCFLFLKHKKSHWYYYYSLVLISLLMLIVIIFKIEI